MLMACKMVNLEIPGLQSFSFIYCFVA